MLLPYSEFIDKEIIFNSEIEKIPESVNIAIVVHGWALRCFFQEILEYDQSFIKKMAMDNTSISQFKYNDISGANASLKSNLKSLTVTIRRSGSMNMIKNIKVIPW